MAVLVSGIPLSAAGYAELIRQHARRIRNSDIVGPLLASIAFVRIGTLWMGVIMSLKGFAGWCAICTVAGAVSARADDLDRQIKALQVIREYAAETCASVAQEGSSQNVELSGEAKAKLGGVFGKLADLGFDGGGSYKSKAYKGVLQNQLAAAIKNSSDCRLEVLRLLRTTLLAPPRARSERSVHSPGNANMQNTYPPQSDTYADGLPKVFPGGIPNVISGFGSAYGYPGGR